MKNKINVNISPNPLDLQTLHCSQNDTGERKFYFTLHNNGEVIDTTDISDPIFEPFDVYKGGTEQLLPINTDEPSTSPIIADIQYPDEEKTEQEFTYRESPTTIDGKALIEKIKGNTIVWNQLIQNGNFADTSVWQNYGSTFTVSENTATVKTTNASNQFGIFQAITFKANHKYFISFEAKKYGTITLKRNRLSSGQEQVQEGLYRNIETASADSTLSSPIRILFGEPVSDIANDYFTVKNYMIIDLTKMGLDSLTVDEFTSLYSLPYYQYGQKLLSFNGTGIKTTGFNQWDEEWELGSIDTSTGTLIPSNVWGRSKNFCRCLPNTAYYLKSSANKYIYWYDASQTFIRSAYGVQGNAYTSPSDAYYFKLANYGWTTYSNDLCFNISSSENGKYEPYTSSTTSIPTSTYFPTGMKSAGTVYDELTNSKAVHRVGAYVSTGTDQTSWALASHYGSYSRFDNNNVKAKVGSSNFVSNMFSAITIGTEAEGMSFHGGDGHLIIQILTSKLSADSPAGLMSYFSSNNLEVNYELETEETTNFTQASLICEDGESTLYQDDDSLVCDCTEDFSKDSGFKDCKIKFTNDDGVVYSNKIQLHIERKP